MGTQFKEKKVAAPVDELAVYFPLAYAVQNKHYSLPQGYFAISLFFKVRN